MGANLVPLNKTLAASSPIAQPPVRSYFGIGKLIPVFSSSLLGLSQPCHRVGVCISQYNLKIVAGKGVQGYGLLVNHLSCMLKALSLIPGTALLGKDLVPTLPGWVMGSDATSMIQITAHVCVCVCIWPGVHHKVFSGYHRKGNDKEKGMERINNLASK